MREVNAELANVTAESPSHFPRSAHYPVNRRRGAYLIYRLKPVYVSPNQFYYRLHADRDTHPLTKSYVYQHIQMQPLKLTPSQRDVILIIMAN
jgi:hypothetical protein